MSVPLAKVTSRKKKEASMDPISNDKEPISGSTDPSTVADPGVRLSAEFDSRLADVWLLLFRGHADLADEAGERLGWFLRMAYLRGYEDAQAETVKGDLYRSLGGGCEVAADHRSLGRGKARPR